MTVVTREEAAERQASAFRELLRRLGPLADEVLSDVFDVAVAMGPRTADRTRFVIAQALVPRVERFAASVGLHATIARGCARDLRTHAEQRPVFADDGPQTIAEAIGVKLGSGAVIDPLGVTSAIQLVRAARELAARYPGRPYWLTQRTISGRARRPIYDHGGELSRFVGRTPWVLRGAARRQRMRRSHA